MDIRRVNCVLALLRTVNKRCFYVDAPLSAGAAGRGGAMLRPSTNGVRRRRRAKWLAGSEQSPISLRTARFGAQRSNLDHGNRLGHFLMICVAQRVWFWRNECVHNLQMTNL
jgi:hypothetical protein